MPISTIILQAETDVTSLDDDSAVISTSDQSGGTLHPNFTGTGFLDINGNAGQKATFKFDVVDVASFEVTLRYANGSGARPISLTSDAGATVELNGPNGPSGSNALSSTNTGDWTNWETATFTVTPTAAGVHTFSINQTDEGAPNIDAVAIHDVGVEPNFADPEITSVATFSVEEGTAAVGTVEASDLDGDDVTFAITDGNDAGLFTIDAGTGAITLSADHTVDADTDYPLTITATDDGDGARSVTQDVTVTVTDALPKPTIDPIVLQAEAGDLADDGESFARTQAPALADLNDGNNAFTIAEGPANSNNQQGDKPLDAFGLREGYSGTGYLDFEENTDESVAWTVNVDEPGQYDLHVRYANGTGDRALNVLVNDEAQVASESFASDGFENWVVKTVKVTLDEGDNEIALAIAGNTNGPNVDAVALTTVGDTPVFPPANSAPVADATVAFDAQEGAVTTQAAAVIDVDADTLSYAIADGADAGFSIDPATGAVSFDAPAFVDGGANTYAATVLVSDGELTASTAVTATVTEAPADDPNAPITIQGEDAAITDTVGTSGAALTVALRDGDTDAFANVLGVDRTGQLGEDEGFLDFGQNPGDSGAFTVNVPVGGVYSATVRYANGSSARPLDVSVDGAVVGQLDGADSGGWNTFVETAINLQLTAGDNTVALTIPTQADGGANNGPNVDQITFALVDQDPTSLTVTPADPQPTENVPGAAVATVVVADADTVYSADQLTLTDDSGQFELVATDVDNTFTLKLLDTEELDAEAASQATLTVSLGDLSGSVTPAPVNDTNDDPADNAAPTVLDGTETTDEDTPVVIDVADLVADDADADDALMIAASATNGAVTVDGTAITFTPDADFNGDAQVTFNATDSDGATSADATVDVTVAAVNDAPTLSGPVADGTVTTAGGVVDLSTLIAADVDGTTPTLGVRLAGGGTPPAGVVINTDGDLVIPADLDAGALDLEVFADDGTAKSESVALTVTIEEAVDPGVVVFDADAVQGYSSQDKPGAGGAGVTVSDAGDAITLSGNLWKRIPFSYALTDDTKLQVTIAVSSTPEIVGIGIDPDADPFNGKSVLFQLDGSQNWGGANDLRGTGVDNSDGTTTFTIDLSGTGMSQVEWLNVFSDDDDASDGLGVATFSNVAFVEDAGDQGGNAAPRIVGGGVADITVDEGGAVEADLAFVDDDGDPLTLGFTVADAGGTDVTAQSGLALVDGAISGTLADALAPGVYTVTATADDGTNAPVSDAFTLTVENVNEAPVSEDPALEPYYFDAGEAIASIDVEQFRTFFSDPDGDALTLSVEDLPAGLSVNGEGVIVGTPSAGGSFDVTVRATDPGGLSDTLTLSFNVEGGEPGDVVTVEAEDFTGLASATGFYATGQAGASGDQLIRVASNGTTGAITTDLAQNGLVEGFYTVAMTRYDEQDGSATYSLSVGDTVLAENAAFDGTADGETANDTFDNADGRGNAGQSGNLKTVVFDTPVFVTAGTVLTLSGQADGELLRTDKFTFTRVDEPNQPPVTIALDAATVAENDAGAAVGALTASDPDGDDAAITFAVVGDSSFEVDGTTLKLKDGEAFDFEADGASVDVTIEATDAGGATAQTTLSITVTNVDEAPGAVGLSASSVDENAAGAVVGTLSADDGDGGVVTTFTTTDARFTVVNGDELALAAGVLLDHEAGETVAVDVLPEGAAAPTTLTIDVNDLNEAPTLAGSLADAAVPAAGGSVSLSGLTAADEDEGQTPTLVVRAAGGGDAPDGVEIVNGELVVAAGLDAGDLALEVVAVDAVDAALESAAVPLTVTVGEPAPFELLILQGEVFTDLGDGDGDPSDDNLIRTQTQNQEKAGLNGFGQADDPDTGADDNPGAPEFDEYGLRPGYSGTGYLDINGDDTGAQAEIAFDAPAGTYDLTIRYANGSSNARPMTFTVDGSAATIADTTTDEWYLWETQTFQVTLTGDGPRTLTIAQNAGAGAPNIDAIALHEPGTTVDFVAGTATDDSADADAFPLTLDGDGGTLSPTQAASINLNVSGEDTDIVKYEVSFDGGVTRADVTAEVDADGDFVVDGSTLAAGPQTATLIVTDAAGNEARATLDFTVAGDDGPIDVDPVTIQGEDFAITDVPGTGTGNETVALTGTDTDAFGNTLGTDRTGYEGAGYLDYGNTVNDAAAFTVDVPADGVYEVTFRYANGDDVARPLDLTINGQAATQVPFAPISGEGDNWNAWGEVTVELTLTAGDNTVSLAIPTAANGGVNNGPNIDQVTVALKDADDGGDGGAGERPDPQVFEQVIKVNFEALPGQGGAPQGYATPAGFASDTGEAYDDRGNGFTYGWVDVDDTNDTVTSTPKAQPMGSMRHKNAASEASDLQKTYAHFDYPGAPQGDRERAWEMELANGTYELTVAIGDTAGQYDSNYVLNVEGEQFGPAWEPVNKAGEKLVGGAYSDAFDGEGFRSLVHTGIVQVTDGRLTLDGIDGDNVEIQWLDLDLVPDLTPGDGRTADLDYSEFVAAVAASTEDGQVSIEVGANGDVPLDINPTSDIVIGVELQAAGNSGPDVAFTDGIRLVETLTGEEVAVNVQVTGGADSMTIKPLGGLKEFTSYTLLVEDVVDLGSITAPGTDKRQFQDYTTTFVTGEAPEVVAKEVAFTDQLIKGDGFGYTSIEFGPDGKLYVAAITGQIHRWDVNPDGTIDDGSQETLSLPHFQDEGRSIIGLAFDPEDPNTIWVTDNATVPREGKAFTVEEFSGRVSKITLGDGGSFADAEAEAYVTGLPRSGGDHVTNSVEFRNIGTEADPEYLLYIMQGSNSAAGAPDDAWGYRPERLLSAAALEIDHKRTDVPQGGFDVQTEPYDPDTDDPAFPIDRTNASTRAATLPDRLDGFNDDGTFPGFYDPFAADAPVKIFGEGIRNGYDLVWHSNGNLYVPTNGTARGGNTLDDPRTPGIDEAISNLDKQYDYLFQVQEGGYYGHPNPLLENYVVNGGADGVDNVYSGVAGINAANTSDGGNEYASDVDADVDYDADGAYSLGFNKSPNGATEYKGDAFGVSLQGAVLFAQFSQGDNIRYVTVDPATGRVTGDDVLRRPGGDEIDEYIDPLDIIEHPVTGQLYMMTLNRGNGTSEIVLLNPAPGGVVADTTADAGNDLALRVIDDGDPTAVLFEVDGLDADITSITVSFDGGAAQVVTLDGQDRFTADVGATDGVVAAALSVSDGTNSKTVSTQVTLDDDGVGSTLIDALAFTNLDSGSTIIRDIDDASTHETGGGNDGNGDGLNDNYDGEGYLDPNGGPEDKASFAFFAPAAGSYMFSFRMANGFEDELRPIAFKTGGQTVEVADTRTGDFTTWQDFQVVLDLVAGDNTIVIAQTGEGAPNVDSVTITPPANLDTTADVGGDLDLVVGDLSDPSEAQFTVSGADDDLVSASVSFTDGNATVNVVLPNDGDFNGAHTANLSALSGAVTATLTVSDGSNTATEGASFDLDAGGVPNDGTETVGGVEFVVYEAENATLTGTLDEVTTGEDNRGQSGGSFVDPNGAGQVSIAWTVEVAQQGTYQVDFVYALAAGKDARPMQLSVDGGAAQTVDFPANSNAAEDVWGPSTVSLDLAPGTHTLTLTASGAASPNLDYLRITQAPLTEPLDLDADEGDDLSLSVVDQTNASAVVFQVTGQDDDIETYEVSFNGGAPVEVTLDANGQFTADAGLTFGQVDAVLTVTDDADNTATAEADFSVAPEGNANADIAVQSLDPTFFDDRLHFSFVSNSDGRASKETAQFEITNTGSEALGILDFTISEFYSVVDPDALAGASIAAGDSLTVTVEFDGSTGGADGFPSRSSDVSGVYEGELTLVTNDAEDPFTTLDLAAFWQPAQEGGNEPNVNEVWQVLGFGNEIAGLPFAGGGENSILDFDDLYLPAPGQEGTEILSPYWRIADGVTEATATIIAAYNASASAGLGIHAPGNKGQDENLATWAPSSQSQTLFPLKNNGDFATTLFDDGDIPNGWAGDDVFGIEMAGLSTDPTLNSSGNGTPSQSALDANYGADTYTVTGVEANAVVTDAEGNVVEDGYTVRMFQALDADGNAIENVFLGMMDYTGINYDYNDNMFIFEGITPVFSGGVATISGLDDAAADDRLVFTNINNPNNGGGLQQNFRDTATFTITNDGLGALDVTALAITGDDAGSFEVVGALPDTIAQGASAQVTVQFVGQDPVNDNAAVLQEATLSVETSAGTQTVALAGLAQLQSEQGEEPTVAQIVEAFGYATNVAQGQLNGGGDVETVGDEVLMPYLERLDASQPVEVINLAAFLQQGDVSRLHLHELEGDDLSELFAGDDQQGQTVLPDGLVAGAGDTGSVGRASIDRDEPFGLKVTVDGRPTFAAWTDPEVNKEDDALGVNDEGHYIRFFQALDGNGQAIEGTFIGIQDYPGGGNFDYNDAMFLVTNVQPHALTAANDANGDDVNDALQNDADGDNTVDFFDGDFTPPAADQAPFGGSAPVLDGSLTVEAPAFDTGGQGVAYSDDPGLDGGTNGGRPGSDVEIIGDDIAYVEAGEWVEYTIDVAEAGTYDLSLVAKAPTAGATVTVSVEDGPALATITLPDSNGPGNDGFGGTTFGPTAAQPVALEAGVQTLRLTFGGTAADNGYLLDLRSFTLSEAADAGNQAPTTTGIADAGGAEGGAFALDVSGAFSDADGDDLTYTASGLPAGLSIDGAGVISGTLPEVAADQTFAVTVMASDGEDDVQAVFDLSVTDETVAPSGQQPFGGTAPVVEQSLTLDALTYDEGGQGVAYDDSPGLDGGGGDGGRTGSDVEITPLGDIGWIQDGEWVEYTIDVAQAGTYDLDVLMSFGSSGARSATVDFTVAGAATAYESSGAIANPSTGGWTSFAERDGGTVDLLAGEQVVRVTFEGGSQDFRSLTLTQQQAAENQVPVAGTIADAEVTENGAISLDVSGAFSDADGDALAYSASGLPAGLSISSAGVITGTAPGVSADTDFAVTVTASDGEASDSTAFTLTVEDVPIAGPTQTPFPGPDAPVIGADAVVVDATNYDAGGQGVSWNDDPGRDGGIAFRSGTDVELVGSQADIGYVEQGEWVEYTVNIAEAGTYALSVNAKSPTGGSTITASIEGGAALATFTLPDSNGASTGFGGTTFADTPTQEIALGAGEQTLRFAFDGTPASNGYLLDFRSFTLDQVEDADTGTDEPEVIGEAGTVTFSQSGSGAWQSVTFAEALENPSVVMGPISLNGAQPGTMRVRDVTDTGFEYQLDEWDYLDGGHTSETVSWLAIEAGTHTVNGQTIVAGIGTASEASTDIAFGQTLDAPVVMAQVASANDPDAVTDRVDDVTATGFSVALDDEEANDSTHGAEDLHWIAVEAGGAASDGFLAGATGNTVTHNTSTIAFGSSFEDEFAFLADMQTEDGGDPATVRLATLAEASAGVFIEEEASGDTEINHTTEVVGYFGVGVGSVLGDDPIG